MAWPILHLLLAFSQYIILFLILLAIGSLFYVGYLFFCSNKLICFISITSWVTFIMVNEYKVIISFLCHLFYFMLYVLHPLYSESLSLSLPGCAFPSLSPFSLACRSYRLQPSSNYLPKVTTSCLQTAAAGDAYINQTRFCVVCTFTPTFAYFPPYLFLSREMQFCVIFSPHAQLSPPDPQKNLTQLFLFF